MKRGVSENVESAGMEQRKKSQIDHGFAAVEVLNAVYDVPECHAVGNDRPFRSACCPGGVHDREDVVVSAVFALQQRAMCG